MTDFTYSKEQRERLETAVTERFGKIAEIIRCPAADDFVVDICVIAPTEEKNFYTLVTQGMGARPMAVPPELAEYKLERAELCLSLPPDWKIGESGEQWSWPLLLLSTLAQLPARCDTWLGWGHTVDNQRPFAENTGFTACMLLTPPGMGDRSVCKLSDDDEVNFYDVIPIYPEELAYKNRYGAQSLLERWELSPEEFCLQPIDLARKNACERFKKQYVFQTEALEPLLKNWIGPEGCTASDRILVDGCKVGYCYRERPSFADSHWDSGWNFFAGDESDEYNENPDNQNMIGLNAVCNCDRSVIPLLRAPYGTAFVREADGSFRRENAPMREEEEAAPAPLLRKEDEAYLQSCCEGAAGYFYRMIAYLQNFIQRGIEEKRFTETEAKQDLGIALWYAYACNNIDEYEFYYRTAEWMPWSEINAKGCGTWYYRYTAALIYCGRLNDALAYAEEGVRQEPDYPWGWLQLGRLRCHFGDRGGALAAAARGLKLVPGDYEFLTLQREIEAGKTLPEMEYHWIDPGADEELQTEFTEDTGEKQISVNGILCDEAGWQRISERFPDADWQLDSPYCSLRIPAGEDMIQLVFRMNRAFLSKQDPETIAAQKNALESGRFTHRNIGGREYTLAGIFLDRDGMQTLVYFHGEERIDVPLLKKEKKVAIADLSPDETDLLLAAAIAENETEKETEQEE